MNPSEVGYYDRWIVSSMIKEIAQSVPLTSNTDDKRFKVVVLHEGKIFLDGCLKTMISW